MCKIARIAILSLLPLCAAAAAAFAADKPVGGPWPADVPGFVKPAPGEHPRLLFRKADLPALRQKSQTPEGQAILKRLRTTLGRNGEEFPDIFSGATKGYVAGYQTYKGEEVNKPGVFTIGHAAGYGLLYQLTGEHHDKSMNDPRVELRAELRKFLTHADAMLLEYSV